VLSCRSCRSCFKPSGPDTLALTTRSCRGHDFFNFLCQGHPSRLLEFPQSSLRLSQFTFPARVVFGHFLLAAPGTSSPRHFKPCDQMIAHLELLSLEELVSLRPSLCQSLSVSVSASLSVSVGLCRPVILFPCCQATHCPIKPLQFPRPSHSHMIKMLMIILIA
jgi:hypothetical protein